MKPGDKVHVTTKQHQTFEGTVVSDIDLVLTVRVVDGSKLQFVTEHIIPWPDVLYCYEQAQWDLERSLFKETDEAINDSGDDC